MKNNEIYKKTFMDTFSVEEEALNQDFTFDNIANWDSIAHMTLMTALEDAFGIMFDTEDILNFTSYEGGKDILAKHGVAL